MICFVAISRRRISQSYSILCLVTRLSAKTRRRVGLFASLSTSSGNPRRSFLSRKPGATRTSRRNPLSRPRGRDLAAVMDGQALLTETAINKSFEDDWLNQAIAAEVGWA